MQDVKIYLWLMISLPISGLSQNSQLLISGGSIVFEKKVNLYANGPVSEDFKKQAGQFRTSYFTLEFNKTHVLYTPDAKNKLLPRTGEQQAENNTVYTDLDQKIYQSDRSIFGETFVVQDTLQKIKWKITSEKRVIAGLECRRANAIILDSVYVVAFYTNAIPVSGGPELFSGLPGMILGVSLPHFHMNWFATKIFDQQSTPLNLEMPRQTKPPLTGLEFTSKLLEIYKHRGEDAGIFLIQSLL